MDYADAYLYFPEHDQAPPYLEPGDVGYSLTDDALMTTAGLTLKVISLMTRRVVRFPFTLAMTLIPKSMTRGSVILPVPALCWKNGTTNSGLLSRLNQQLKLPPTLLKLFSANTARQTALWILQNRTAISLALQNAPATSSTMLLIMLELISLQPASGNATVAYQLYSVCR